MLKAALELKGLSQKFIDFAHMYGAGDGGEGEDDLEEMPDSEEMPPEEAPEEETAPSRPMGKPNKKAALIIAIEKKKGKK